MTRKTDMGCINTRMELFTKESIKKASDMVTEFIVTLAVIDMMVRKS